MRETARLVKLIFFFVEVFKVPNPKRKGGLGYDDTNKILSDLNRVTRRPHLHRMWSRRRSASPLKVKNGAHSCSEEGESQGLGKHNAGSRFFEVVNVLLKNVASYSDDWGVNAVIANGLGSTRTIHPESHRAERLFMSRKRGVVARSIGWCRSHAV
jgi:hypothetical protein